MWFKNDTSEDKRKKMKLVNEFWKERRPFLFAMFSVMFICFMYLLMRCISPEAEKIFLDKLLPIISSILTGTLGYYLGNGGKSSSTDHQ